MKKYLFITVLILSLNIQNAKCEDVFANPDALGNIQETFYQAPSIQVSNDDDKAEDESALRGTPWFKKTRIKITNFIREKDYQRTQRLLEKEKAKEKTQLEEDYGDIPEELKESEVQPISDENTPELAGGVREHVAPNEVQLDADNIDFDNQTADVIATGSPVVYFPPQKTTIKADKLIYNTESNKLKAIGNVEVIKDGNSIYGDFLQINMNEETSVMDNVKTENTFLKITARTSEMDEKTLTLYDGKMVADNSFVLRLESQMISGINFDDMLVKEEDKSSLSDAIGETAIKIKAKDVIVNAKKDHDTFTLKKAEVNYGDIGLFNIPSLTIHTNKKHNFFEANYPEFGSVGQLGMFAGPGFVFDTPLQGGSTLKVIPIINNKSGIGFGGMLKYMSPTNQTMMAYGSSADVFVLRGIQHLDDKLYLQYGSNSYMDEGFIGPRMAKYDAELIYRDSSTIKDFLGKDKNLFFDQRAGIGYMQNTTYDNMDEKFAKDDTATMRMRYMASANQDLFKYIDKENQKMFRLGVSMQGSAAVYGTGDTQFIGRVGPNVKTQYKRWMQDIYLYLSAYQDGTPMQMYDSYRYGHTNLMIREAFRICKYLSVAWAGSFALADDAPNGNFMQENTFIIAVGPDDVKLQLGYDWLREQTYFAIVVAMDTKGSSLEYDKMVIKNPDRLAKSNEEEVELKVFDNPENSEKPKAKLKKMMYAEVIDIEEPDRESIE
ncbi:LPS-assembly protein LptD [bacterium]|nr:LPS-assembly protein LptD [bacterium]